MQGTLNADYGERVYAGVLGKIIGVYAGRPFENWLHETIVERWGEIRRYVHEDQEVPLIAPDDDITGTFTFIRALADHSSGANLSSAEIGQSWLNYIAEGRHILWWGGMGMSTEHTAYVRLASGIPAPNSGSIAINGKAVAEEIGAQIFIDGWALVAPNQPDLAVRFAREAALVSHDGEAVHAAVMLAAMESLAFAESDIATLLDCGLSYLPADSEIARMIVDLRAWHRDQPDWRQALALLRAKYGYHKYLTNCPVVPNHGIIILALLYGRGDFDESLMIVNTAGHDTDCNSGNVGCLLGIRGGLLAINSCAYDWRTPVNDRLYLPAADGHRGVSDAATVACELINLGRCLAGEVPLAPKAGARYHFDLPGATHGFALSGHGRSENRVYAGTMPDGERVLVLEARNSDESVSAEVATFIPPDSFSMKSYAMAATPKLYPGQEIVAWVAVAPDFHGEGRTRLFVRSYHTDAGQRVFEGPWQTVAAGAADELRWVVPPTENWPVLAVGVEWSGAAGQSLWLRSLTWSGQPEMVIESPVPTGPFDPWAASFVHDLDLFHPRWGMGFTFAKSRGAGIAHTGGRDWQDYEISADLRPMIGEDFGLIGRVQGLTRYYALLVTREGRLRLTRVCHHETVLAEVELKWPWAETRRLSFRISGDRLSGSVDGYPMLEASDSDRLLDGGGAGWRVTSGRIESGALKIRRAVSPL